MIPSPAKKGSARLAPPEPGAAHHDRDDGSRHAKGIGLAGDIEEAMKLAQSAEFDLAILDVNIKSKLISPVELVKARNCPFIFATGYAEAALPEEYCDAKALPAWRG
jgi:hypothetical protein